MTRRLTEIDDAIIDMLRKDGKCSTTKLVNGIRHRKGTIRVHIKELCDRGVIVQAPVDNCDVRHKFYRLSDSA